MMDERDGGGYPACDGDHAPSADVRASANGNGGKFHFRYEGVHDVHPHGCENVRERLVRECADGHAARRPKISYQPA